MRRYSRLAQVEHKKNRRAIFVYGFLTIALIVLLLFFGLPSIVRLAGFLTDLRSSGQSVEINDKTPPAPSRFEIPPEYTNKSRIEISGSAEAGATVKLFINGDERETVADDSGKFSFSVSLSKGDNQFWALVIDKSGNESTESSRYKVVYDDKEPLIEISSPSDGQTFSGSASQRIEIKGTTETEATVKVNDRIAIIDSEGNFSLSISLIEGQNTLELIATDPAGNKATKSLTVNYSP
ncbi:hypothetical protein A2630_00060 [Candidatus Woesebacteria bacterium RIFCSPHIGHO2_01_FULL_44_10]|uniref:Bacterial Ig-like domain-containing protein n=1 Tax=Candidatus Woesebacteria bacterium RIFCSPLOWO2_01_FULL_44_14 TaxID=1802525 RepID=A0A1F8BX72_9BACT|nr:MAG: hypothetical protein A2630_00060 [Candidatus Woesebacteria bacterium RIFCSPHIGHO2_01_FULL_44_10]OGM56268.1 MAG: hypothetical protein A3F62_03380 [Candidatus Woesebacteria bacterium RIFCSPHIGHO2_12_FULL_44_11]OGM68704.1 MAG: hypothetical protein A2975_05360 [Candidatus Woesebacteria bacterium RIFCSPLOWO2_01_FULL_44_14]